MCSYFMLVIKSFDSLKNESLHFRTRILFKGGSQVPQKFEGGLLLQGEMTDLDIFWGGGLGKKG